MPHCGPQDSFLLKQPSVADFEWVNLLFPSARLSLDRHVAPGEENIPT
jgi:hypothetical protein